MQGTRARLQGRARDCEFGVEAEERDVGSRGRCRDTEFNGVARGSCGEERRLGGSACLAEPTEKVEVVGDRDLRRAVISIDSADTWDDGSRIAAGKARWAEASRASARLSSTRSTAIARSVLWASARSTNAVRTGSPKAFHQSFSIGAVGPTGSRQPTGGVKDAAGGGGGTRAAAGAVTLGPIKATMQRAGVQSGRVFRVAISVAPVRR
jgi:hypothetical protein